MRHRKAGRKLGRITAHRTAMLRNMVTSVLEHERIVTTVPKAKEARRIVDQMITLGKRGDLHAKRQALAYIHSRDVLAMRHPWLFLSLWTTGTSRSRPKKRQPSEFGSIFDEAGMRCMPAFLCASVHPRAPARYPRPNLRNS